MNILSRTDHTRATTSCTTTAGLTTGQPSIADQLRALLDDSRIRLCTETHTPGQTAARSYARALWAIEDDIRALADRFYAEESGR
ncbi:hypothetical protein G4X40_21450 [Rhodococcus sp. D2-41]|uniref:hypothetical protein n=1 Tax=Speluncibacter jeojiensis TaxID=2710754 RepID=UPI00241056A0|nr:hypothetical protein [Rhodococcus sp. D2-41]MDG3012709.1 hypothetical protein [Rhodococcus sp. D2-41]